MLHGYRSGPEGLPPLGRPPTTRGPLSEVAASPPPVLQTGPGGRVRRTVSTIAPIGPFVEPPSRRGLHYPSRLHLGRRVRSRRLPPHADEYGHDGSAVLRGGGVRGARFPGAGCVRGIPVVAETSVPGWLLPAPCPEAEGRFVLRSGSAPCIRNGRTAPAPDDGCAPEPVGSGSTPPARGGRFRPGGRDG
jgi:hypothetical protein